MKKIIVLTIATVFIFILVLGAKSIATSAMQNRDSKDAFFESYEIREQDTLWSISSDYAKQLGMSTRDYVREIKRINGLTNDKIVSGGKLILLCARD